MPISRDEVLHIARLAHVGIEGAEIEELAVELSSIVDHVARLQEVDTTGLEGAGDLGSPTVMRDDEVAPSWPVEKVLANAPHRSDDLFEVQAIFD